MPLARTSAEAECPFCRTASSSVLLSNSQALAIPDGFPVGRGHTLVIPRVHVASLFDLSNDAQTELWRLVGEVRAWLNSQLQPAGFNIGINDGIAAGQTVAHAHVHVIPRFVGDVHDPRGGIRWVLPSTAAYWRTAN